MLDDATSDFATWDAAMSACPMSNQPMMLDTWQKSRSTWVSVCDDFQAIRDKIQTSWISRFIVVLGSTKTPLVEMTCPRKTTSINQNLHLLNLVYSWFPLSLSNTNLRCSSCSSSILESMRISLIKTTMNLSRYSTNTYFIRYMK
jgi:hypothetical protein